MSKNDQHSMIKTRRALEEDYFKSIDSRDIVKSISSVDITTIDLCNRDCIFCPRHDPNVYPNRNLRMSAEGARIIGSKLAEIDYKGTIGLSGFGENLLNPEIVEITRAFRETNPSAYLEINTNGDPLDKKLYKDLIVAGLDKLNINIYDGPEQISEFDKVVAGTEHYRYRIHYNPKDYGIFFNNRSGMIDWISVDDDIEAVKNNPCYYPFYKMMIDWNGDVLFCANDWGRQRVIGNLLQQSVAELWMSKEMLKVRMRLAKGNRNFKPCNTCSVKGTMVGKASFDLLMEYYNEDSRNRQ